MKLWVTEIRAIEPHTGELLTWGGEYVQAPTLELAREWCRKNKGYLNIIGELVAEIPCKNGTLEADFSKMIDYENIQNN